MTVQATTMDGGPQWTPKAAAVARSAMRHFMREASAVSGRELSDYQALWQWSIDEREAFWSLAWRFFEVIGEAGEIVLENGDRMPGAHWFPAARLNYAENLLRHCRPGDLQEALVFWGEDKVKRSVSRGSRSRAPARPRSSPTSRTRSPESVTTCGS